ERELIAFQSLRSALHAQGEALKLFDIRELETAQIQIEIELAHTENLVFERVKWQQKHLKKDMPPTWRAMLEQAPNEVSSNHAEHVMALRRLGDEVKVLLAKNQRYAGAANAMLGALKHVEQRVVSEKTDLYTARGRLSNQVAVTATSGGAR
ncbi:MAG: hypothetical protein ACPGQS_09695, partial [Bradymonadia bacterium]